MREEKFSDDAEVNMFCRDLLESVADMKADRYARKTEVEVSWIAGVRTQAGFTQREFAKALGVSVRTLEAWEKGERQPKGSALLLLRIGEKHPELLAKVACA
ncbi:MAG: helix-turn-helix domain-containing protein [Sutterellaceae bacterium]|nr:helix-turn-helix domain-containing protein [Sutterellaceae bacterium]